MRRLWRRLLDDEMFARRWLRVVMMGTGAWAASNAETIAGMLDADVGVVSAVSALVTAMAVAINLGDKNPDSQAPAPLRDDEKTPVGG